VISEKRGRFRGSAWSRKSDDGREKAGGSRTEHPKTREGSVLLSKSEGLAVIVKKPLFETPVRVSAGGGRERLPEGEPRLLEKNRCVGVKRTWPFAIKDGREEKELTLSLKKREGVSLPFYSRKRGRPTTRKPFKIISVS